MEMPNTGLFDTAHALVQGAAIIPDHDVAQPPFVEVHMLLALLNGE